MIEKFLILFFSICFAHCIAQQLPLLPGVKVLELGYDAVKMHEQSSKFPLFDFTDQSYTSFVMNKLDQQRTYTVPAMIQATDISLRREIDCESISYDFKQFYSSYFRTYEFNAMMISRKIFVAMEYHEILKRVYEAITKHSQAIGTSSIWWGMYSIQLPPSYLLKFHPKFNESIHQLISQARNPTTESQQQLYNEFVQNYGTSYATHAIVGGTAHLYTFIARNYHTVTSYAQLVRGISLTVRNELSQNDFPYEDLYESFLKSFEENTYSMPVFEPLPRIVKNESAVQAWINATSEQPIVINRTLTHIANLIRDDEQVQDHLRRTVDFYLKNGFLPSLVDLQYPRSFAARRVSPPVQPIGPLPGLDVVGCTYDLLTLQSRSCILDTSNSSENEHWTDPYNSRLTYSLPNGFFATNTPESLTLDATIMITSVEDYYRRTHRVDFESFFAFFYTRDVQRETTEFYRRFYQDYYNLVVSLKQIGWYTLSTSVFPYPKLTPTAQKALADLPSTFDVKDLNIWNDFFSSFGAYVVISAQMGGQVWAENWYEKCLTYEHSEVWIKEQVRETFLFFFGGQGETNQHHANIDKRFKEFSSYSSHVLGGKESIPAEKWKEWLPTVKSYPRPISHRLIPLYQLLPKGNQRTALQAATEYIANQTNMEGRAYIANLQSLRGPPPTNCSRNRVRRSITSSTQSPQLNYTQIQKALCPYVGYNGRTCTGVRGRQSFVPVYRRLPVGVGMGFDITTGYVLLPVIDFTHDNNTSWQDPLTNKTYWYPREVSVLSVDETANQPIARVFPSASELANHWKYGAQRGDWIGGEFGHSKSILDLQQQFFSDDQAIAITQKPYVLYRLKIEVLKLNVYARSAIDILPKVYDEIIYADFLRNWGTHIILRSLIGGMHEQQVSFKDCVFSFNGAITPENLDEYLKKDILAQTLGNTFYAERRKVTIDHRLGGEPSLSNVTAWQNSLSENPALLKIEELIPWYEIVDDLDVKANLQLIIQNRIDTYERNRIREEAQIMNQRANARMLALKGSIGLLNNGACEINTPVIFGATQNCSNGCASNARIKSPNGFASDRPLFYVRDPATGFVQAQVRLQDGTILTGSRVSVGCSTLSFPTMLTQSASICVGCTLVNSFANACTCVCPAYPSTT